MSDIDPFNMLSVVENLPLLTEQVKWNYGIHKKVQKGTQILNSSNSNVFKRRSRVFHFQTTNLVENTAKYESLYYWKLIW